MLLEPAVPRLRRRAGEDVETVGGAHAPKASAAVRRRSGRDAGDGEREADGERGAETHARDDGLHLTDGGDPVVLLKRFHRPGDRQRAHRA